MVENARINVRFENFPVLNQSKSKEQGRPIYDDQEVCRIFMSGDRLNAPVFPAHSETTDWHEREDGTTERLTYAQKYNAQYLAFKAGSVQTLEGTPVENLPFLSKSKAMELKALHIYTAESLASLDGAALKTLGQGGREWKNQAQAYLDNAAGSAEVTKLASDAEFWKTEAERLQRELDQRPMPDDKRISTDLGYGTEQQGLGSEDNLADETTVSEFEDWNDDLLKEYIAEKSGSKPRGNPAHSTLVRMCDDLSEEASE